MGFFKDLNKLNQQGKELRKGYDPAQQMQQATQNMAATTEWMRMQNEAAQLQTSGTQASFQLMAVRNTGMEMNFQPIVEVDLMVTVGSTPPYPATTRAIADPATTARLVPGTTFDGKADPTQPNMVWVNWLAPPAPTAPSSSGKCWRNW